MRRTLYIQLVVGHTPITQKINSQLLAVYITITQIESAHPSSASFPATIEGFTSPLLFLRPYLPLFPLSSHLSN